MQMKPEDKRFQTSTIQDPLTCASPPRALSHLLPATACFMPSTLPDLFLDLSEHQLLSLLTDAFQALVHLVMNFGKNDPFL
jgi:hypothetical protein